MSTWALALMGAERGASAGPTVGALGGPGPGGGGRGPAGGGGRLPTLVRAHSTTQGATAMQRQSRATEPQCCQQQHDKGRVPRQPE
jgi:hypothetical protein